MYKVRREIKDGQLVKEAFDPNGIESFGHVQEHRTYSVASRRNSWLSVRRGGPTAGTCYGWVAAGGSVGDTYIHTRTHTHPPTMMHAHTHMHNRKLTNTHTGTHTLTYKHIHTHSLQL